MHSYTTVFIILCTETTPKLAHIKHDTPSVTSLTHFRATVHYR